jgi:DNA-directed RNA polymerase specialized sigma24 family protein
MTRTPSEGVTIPKSYEELQQNWGKFIFDLLQRINKIQRNMDDLYQQIWLKLIEADFLTRFDDYKQTQMPKVLSAVDSCDLLGVTWVQWVTAMGLHHNGIPVLDEYGKVISRKKGRWMPTPINIAEFEAAGLAGYTSMAALYAFEDVIRLSFETHRCANGSLRRAFKKMGQDVRGGLLYGSERPEGAAKLPAVRVTKSMFKNYLAMAVGNHFANYCRTEFRRHKERPFQQPTFVEDDAPFWETALPDPKAVKSDTMVALSQAKQILSNTLFECLEGVQTPKKPEDHATEMFRHLYSGASLKQALCRMDLPPTVRSAVLNTIRPMAESYIML